MKHKLGFYTNIYENPRVLTQYPLHFETGVLKHHQYILYFTHHHALHISKPA